MSAVVGAGAGAARAVAGAAAGEGRMTARARASTNGGSAAGWRVSRWGEGRAGRSRVSGGVGGGFSGAALGGAGRAGADKSTAAVAVNGEGPSIDGMDMDPEHVKFASQDELDQRCVGGSHLIRRPLHSFASPRARFTDRTPGARASPTRRPARPRPKTFKR